MKPHHLIQRVLADYKLGKMTLPQIARKHRVSKESVIGWAKKASLPARRRGQPKRVQPTPRQEQILKLAKIYTYEAVARRFGVSKQEISRIAKRWGMSRKDQINRAVNQIQSKLPGTYAEDSPLPSVHFSATGGGFLSPSGQWRRHR